MFVCIYVCMNVIMFLCIFVYKYVWMFIGMFVRVIHRLLPPPHHTTPYPQSPHTAHISVLHCNAATSSHQHVTAPYSRNQTYCSLLSFIPSTPSFLVRFINYCNYCVMVHSSFALAWSLRPSVRTIITH